MRKGSKAIYGSPGSGSAFGFTSLIIETSCHKIELMNMAPERMDHLKRPKGYEVAKQLIEDKKSRSDIEEAIAYGTIHYETLDRLLDPENDECDVNVFKRAKTRGEVKWTLNTELFSENEREVIRDRAPARVRDNIQEVDKTFTTTTTDDASPTIHMDAKNMPSRFNDDYE